MQSLLKLSILAACLAITMAVNTHAKLPVLGHRKLMDFMVQSRDVSQRNPERSLTCFDYYVPILNDITAEYEISYAACIKDGDAARSKVDSSTQPERDQIENSARDSCYALKDCTAYKSSIEYFECFANAGSSNSKAMYVVSANASDYLGNVREQYRLIENDQNRCTNNSERAYVENTASTYEELHNCLLGLSPIPSTTSSPEPTTSESTTATTGKDPTSEPTTEEDTTTSQPVDSTTAAEVFDNPRARFAIKDSKWSHILGKMARHIH